MHPLPLPLPAFCSLLQATLSGSALPDAFVLFPHESSLVKLSVSATTRTAGDWSLLESLLPPEGQLLPLLAADRTAGTVGMLWTAPGVDVSAGTLETLAWLLTQFGAQAAPTAGQLIEHLPEAAALLDERQQLVAANSAWHHLLGSSPEASPGQLADVLPDWTALLAVLPEALAGHVRLVPPQTVQVPGRAPEHLGGELRPWLVPQTSRRWVLCLIWRAGSPVSGLPPDLYQEAFARADPAMIVTSNQGIVLLVNDAATALLEQDMQSTLGEPLWALGLWQQDPVARRRVRVAAVQAARGRPTDEELAVKTPAGERTMFLRVHSLTGQQLLFQLSERARAGKDILHQEAVLETMLRHAQEGLLVCDSRGQLVLFNQAAREMLGQDVSAVPPEEWPRHFALQTTQGEPWLDAGQLPLLRALAGEEVRGVEIILAPSERARRHVLVDAYPLQTAQPPVALGAVAFMRDVTERSHLSGQLQHLTQHDPLTTLPNRHNFLGLVEQALQRQHTAPTCRYAVLLCAIGGMEGLKGLRGSVQAHRLVLEGAARLVQAVRGSDVVARFEGEQFAVLLERPGPEASVDAITTRLRERLKAPFLLDGHEFTVDLHIGVVTDLLSYQDPEAVLRDAAAALYAARLQQTEVQPFRANVREELGRRVNSELALRSALHTGQLRLYYQPELHLRQGRVSGFRVLLGWQHPQQGLLWPETFLAGLQDRELYEALGKWTVQQVIGQQRQWRTLDPDRDFTIGLDITWTPMTDTSPLGLYGVLEDGADLDAEEQLTSTLWELGQLYHHSWQTLLPTSLSASRVNPTQPSVTPRLFVGARTVTRLPQDLDILNHALTLARHLELDLMADGIETQEQLGLLRGIGCVYATGPFVSPPLPPEAAWPFAVNGDDAISRR
ncbi:hypothetical protein Dcar01_03355 [Deinococcus carri]|uniref:Diguanylate cyclase n=1 Tax=Deinococcus carri TaxID=1211323 RepID=A0ABP9WB86_9DEIO